MTNTAISKSVWRQQINALFILFFTSIFASLACAQNYPSRTITIVMPYVAGGPTDAAFRDLARVMSQDLGQSVIVENKPGGGALLGAQYVSRAKPDGYILLASVVANMVTSPLLMQNPPYNPSKDFLPISMVSTNPLILVASKSSGITSLGDLIAKAKAKPGEIAIASYGHGTPSHLAIELLKTTAKIDVIDIPYNGSAPAMIDLRGGRVPLIMDILPSQVQTLANGDVIGLAIAQKKRSEIVPSVPTFQEAGLPGFEALTWMALSAPAGTPKEIITKINESVQRSSADPAYQAAMRNRGMPVTPSSSEEMDLMIRNETTKWEAVIRNAAIKKAD